MLEVNFAFLYPIIVALYAVAGAVLCNTAYSRRSAWMRGDVLDLVLLVVLILIVGVIGTTNPYTDMVRMVKDIQKARATGIDYLFNVYSSVPLSAALLAVGALSGVDRLVQGIAVFLFYGGCFLSLSLLKRRRNIEEPVVVGTVVLLLWVVDYTAVAYGLRFWAALGLLVAGVSWIETSGKPGRHAAFGALLCVSSVLMHFGTAVLLAVYVASRVIRPKKGFVALLVLAVLYSPALILASPHMAASKVRFVAMLGRKGLEYFGLSPKFATSYDATRPFSWWFYMYLTVIFVVLVAAVNSYLRVASSRGAKHDAQARGREPFEPKVGEATWRMGVASAALAVSSVFSWTMGTRYGVAGALFGAPLFMEVAGSFHPALLVPAWRGSHHLRGGEISKSEKRIKIALFVFMCCFVALVLAQRVRTTYPGYYIAL